MSDVNAVLNMLYSPAKDSRMPGYSFLFEERKIVGQPSPEALNVSVAAGYEVVPTERARSLAAYLSSLNDTYTYPEVNFVPPTEESDAEHAEEGGH